MLTKGKDGVDVSYNTDRNLLKSVVVVIVYVTGYHRKRLSVPPLKCSSHDLAYRIGLYFRFCLPSLDLNTPIIAIIILLIAVSALQIKS